MKKLSEMSNEELWQLFPIFLTEHRKEWKSMRIWKGYCRRSW